MKEFILSASSLIIISLVVEMFCPAKVMKKSLYMALSLVVLFVIISGVKNIFTSDNETSFENYTLKLESQGETICLGIIETTESQILNALSENGIETSSVKLDYEVNELRVKITSAQAYIESEEQEAKAKEIIQNLTGLKKEEITIYV